MHLPEIVYRVILYQNAMNFSLSNENPMQMYDWLRPASHESVVHDPSHL